MRDHDHRFECVRLVPIFDGLSEADQHRIAETAVTRTFEPREQVYGAGDRTGLHIVHRGQVKAYRLTEGGSEQLVRLLSPGDFLGESALLADSVSDHFAMAIRRSEVCSVPRAGMRQLLVERPAVALQMLQTVSGRLAAAEEMLAAVTGQSVGERLAQQLLHLADEAGSASFRLPTSKRDLASYLGTTPETLSRRLGALQRSGAVRLGPQRTVTVVDRRRLEQLGAGAGPPDRGPH
ncbi:MULTISPECIES: Crp/Fnr family transcriptional regulator [unclassified Nocardioides]|uniref:Crp/Fnr family transcriptional regulator n=1 Tax=unclassified Nocardioides TaxID=2615069 RepID=UPI0000574C08|nr:MULTISPECIES: Crp/Fnr family transcriptional regulator [unclassified Nocardioides]ABL81133.1 cyclic nucleotide-binding protein [Nocardioides sp. JS614]